MKYLLDTCVISELTKPIPEPRVTQWIIAQHESDLCISVLTVGELQKGIAKLPESKRKATLQQWLNTDLKSRFDNRILDISSSITQTWGEVQGASENQGKKMAVIDGLIAITALVNNATVVTRNIDDMTHSGVALFNPWQG